jgi:hypothetical protein
LRMRSRTSSIVRSLSSCRGGVCPDSPVTPPLTYVCPGGEEWITNERRLDRNDLWRKSGYELSGRRGCVMTITLNQGEDERQMARAAALGRSFALGADRLIRSLCGTEMADSLRDSIHAPH